VRRGLSHPLKDEGLADDFSSKVVVTDDMKNLYVGRNSSIAWTAAAVLQTALSALIVPSVSWTIKKIVNLKAVASDNKPYFLVLALC